MQKTVAQHVSDFKKAFEPLSRTKSRGQAFADFIEIAALTIHQAPYHAGLLDKDDDYGRIEALYLETIKRIPKNEHDKLVKLYSVATVAVAETASDFLGRVYMELEISNDRTGQFFTPPELQRMMAMMTMSDVGTHITQKGYVTISEPAAGAGGMLIEAANVINEQGFNPSRTMWFQAIDIDRTCFNMAYFQLSSLGLSGEVIHGNALSMEMWERRITPASRITRLLAPSCAIPKENEAPRPELLLTPAAPKGSGQFTFDFGGVAV